MLSTTSPFSFILFGASGHLAKLKIYPALYVLALKKRLPDDYAIIGYARTPMDQSSFRALVADSVKEAMQNEVNAKALENLLAHLQYHQGHYDSPEDFKKLAARVDEIEKKWKDPVRLAYLSIPPKVFPVVVENLCKGNVHNGDPRDSESFVAQDKLRRRVRIIVEKPVGNDLKSFDAIRTQLTDCFEDHEIFLLDHYLGKDAVRNIYYLRFANPILERLFKNSLIHHVEITAMESAGIEGRAGYFDHTGTFRDMFQSHLLMMGSLLTMHLKDDDSGIRESRMNALSQFYLPPAGDLDEIVMQGQYAEGTAKDGTKLRGYLEEDDVTKDSRANTFAALKLQSRESRWQGVPFYLRSGKRMEKKETRISIQFQEPRAVGKGSSPNRLDIILQGEAGMRMHLQTRIGGVEPAFRPLIVEDPLVCVGDCLPEHGLLLLEAIHGRQHWFLTFEEVQASWRLIGPLLTHLEKKKTALYTYPAGTNGPAEANTWIERDGVKWF